MIKKIGRALVVGAGISGIRAALDLAETGYNVTLIDQSDHLGGVLSQLDYQFPTNRCGMCKMLPLVDRDASSQYCLRKGLFHENIDIHLSTELVSLSGEPGNFQVTLREKARWVDPDLCVGCGICADVCPVEVPDVFNASLSSRKAIYLPVPHAVPNPYVIDFSSCTRCGECEKVCPTTAIRLSEQEREKFRILVVDDELIVRDSLREWLGEEGFTVDIAESGQEALEMLARTPYRLMLTDIKMPGMDGVELLKKAKEDYPELTVVMMTAYATMETAVEAMKIGALDYLVKPFNPDKLVPMTLRIYENLEATKGRRMEVGAVVLCGGIDYFDPAGGKNIWGYGLYPNVVTSLEFERIFSGTGPSQGELVRPSDGKPVRKVAWIQCVGSRDLQMEADFCSNICCMYAIKEALVAKERTGGRLEATIFYMDMRTFGKSYQRYREEAETVHGIRFERGRVHSVVQDDTSTDLMIRYVDSNGAVHESRQDMVVLSIGQRPSTGTAELANAMNIGLNPWGFIETEPFSVNRTIRDGITVGGGFSGIKDITESVIQASSAALSASRSIHASGGSLIPEPDSNQNSIDISRESPRIMVVICTCSQRLSENHNMEGIAEYLKRNPVVERVEFLEQTCTVKGWDDLAGLVEDQKPNRLLIAACLPYVYGRKLRDLAQRVALSPSLMDVVDIHSPLFSMKPEDKNRISAMTLSTIEMGIAKLKRLDPSPVPTVRVSQQALVVGGGIAGMTAALAIADHGFQVDLVEQSDTLGGNLLWLRDTVEGNETRALLDETCKNAEKHPLIRIHTGTHVVSSHGQVGQFSTVIEDTEGRAESLTHGITILATGGREASTSAYGYGASEAVVTQMALEIMLNDGSVDPTKLKTVVMIQCVDSREEPRNYCSRVCCSSALKHALYLKEKNPDVQIYVLYRDIMAYGFLETYYTRARKAGVVFIRYGLEHKPVVESSGNAVSVTVPEPTIGREIIITPDLVVLAPGVVPTLPPELAQTFGCSVDQDGFFQEADSKWRPVDSLKEGVYACGLALSPRSIPEAIATAEAAAQRGLRVLSRKELPSGKLVAKVRHSICSLCEKCIDACPYGARSLDEDEEKIVVNPVMCQGCGLCAAVCPNSAAILECLKIDQVMEVIDAALLNEPSPALG